MSSLNQYEDLLIKLMASYPDKFKTIFAKAAKRMADLSSHPGAKYINSFAIPQYPPLRKEIAFITTDLHKDILKEVESGIKYSWNLSYQKNNALYGEEAMNEAMIARNSMALAAFVNRSFDSETLSDRVWRIAKQARLEMELQLSAGIMKGESAAQISKNIRQYLNNPDTLFRRVKDATTGKLVPSKAMKAFHPGRGVYRSAYKNAMRVARSEVNMAYHLSDHLRWLSMEMVIGIRISLSESHPDYKFPEICEILEGDYPKEFFFPGWHPQCLCHQTPILSNEDQFLNYLEGKVTKIHPANKIKQLPENFKNYIGQKGEALMNMENPPYFIQENGKLIDVALEQKGIIVNVPTPPEPVMEKIITTGRYGFKDPGDVTLFENFKKGYSDLFKGHEERLIEENKIRTGNNYADLRTLNSLLYGDPSKDLIWQNIKEWHYTTEDPGVGKIKIIAESVEQTPPTVFRHVTEAEKEAIFSHEFSKEDYLRLRALNQAYMEAIGVPDEITLYRGTDGRYGKKMVEEIAKELIELDRAGKPLTTLDAIEITDNSLVGYSDLKHVGDNFGNDKGGITVRQIVKREDIILHRDLMSGVTGTFTSENEYIIKGIDKAVAMKDIRFKLIINFDLVGLKNFDEDLSLIIQPKMWKK